MEAVPALAAPSRRGGRAAGHLGRARGPLPRGHGGVRRRLVAALLRAPATRPDRPHQAQEGPRARHARPVRRPTPLGHRLGCQSRRTGTRRAPLQDRRTRPATGQRQTRCSLDQILKDPARADPVQSAKGRSPDNAAAEGFFGPRNGATYDNGSPVVDGRVRRHLLSGAQRGVFDRNVAMVDALESGEPIGWLARRYRVSRQWVSALRRRYAAGGEAGLLPRSRRPTRQPHGRGGQTADCLGLVWLWIVGVARAGAGSGLERVPVEVGVPHGVEVQSDDVAVVVVVHEVLERLGDRGRGVRDHEMPVPVILGKRVHEERGHVPPRTVSSPCSISLGWPNTSRPRPTRPGRCRCPHALCAVPRGRHPIAILQ